MLKLILDTDFASSFIKISRFELIRKLYNVEFITLPQAVYNELSRANLGVLVDSLDWIRVEEVKLLDSLLTSDEMRSIGSGQREAIELARKSIDSLLLMNDSKARRIAEKKGVRTVDVPGFLLACQEKKLLTISKLRSLIDDLRDKDHYKFKPEVKAYLLKGTRSNK